MLTKRRMQDIANYVLSAGLPYFLHYALDPVSSWLPVSGDYPSLILVQINERGDYRLENQSQEKAYPWTKELKSTYLQP